jgi:hypothetical protein
MPKELLAMTAEQWALCQRAVGRYGVPPDEANRYRQGKLYAWLQSTHEEEAAIREGGPEILIERRIARSMKRRLVAIITDFAFQGWRQSYMASDVEPTLAELGWFPEYEDDDEDDET